VRDLEAHAWGSLDVSEDVARARLEALTPEGWKRVESVMLSRVEASRERQRAAEERIERLEELRKRLEEL
jgi:hypothetical protein